MHHFLFSFFFCSDCRIESSVREDESPVLAGVEGDAGAEEVHRRGARRTQPPAGPVAAGTGRRHPDRDAARGAEQH